MSMRVARKRAAEADRARALLVLLEAAVTLQADTARVIRRCLDLECNAGAELAHQVTRLTSSYAYLISQVDELPSSVVVDEAASLLRYHHMLLAETARYSFNAPNSAVHDRLRFDGTLGPPAARLRRLRDLIAGFVEQNFGPGDDGAAGAVRMPRALSHNMLTPLTTILGNASSLLQPDVTWDRASERRLLSGIVNESQRLARVVDNVLSLALMTGGTLKPAFDWCDPFELISAAVDHVDPALDLPYRLHITSDVSDDPGDGVPMLWADHDLLRRALTDLLDNAARHPTRKGHVRIGLTASAERVTITIDDDGPGLPASVRRAIDAATTKRLLPTSVGTGIPTALGAIRLHHGTLTYPNAEPVSRCLIELPNPDSYPISDTETA
jgi:signal transduction histidine kinase